MSFTAATSPWSMTAGNCGCLRELQEEFGLSLIPGRLTYEWRYYREFRGRTACFVVGAIARTEIDSIEFGNEDSAGG